MISLAILSAIEADVKSEPAQARDPQRYAKKLECLRGDNTRVHTYCPPARGMAELISDKVIPIQ